MDTLVSIASMLNRLFYPSATVCIRTSNKPFVHWQQQIVPASLHSEFLLITCSLFSSSQPLANETNLQPEEMRASALYKEPVDPAKWFGIRKDATVLGYSQVVPIEFLQQVVHSDGLQ